MDILLNLTIMLCSLFAIVIACITFTNAIEHLGEHLGLSNRTMGSVFAAIGTALPETLVPLVAILGAYIAGINVELSQEIGIGAILGSPFMISTFAFFITSIFIYIFAKTKFRKLEINANPKPILRDLSFFLTTYTIAILGAFIKFQYSHILFAILLFAFYVLYIVKTIKTDEGETPNAEEIPLYFQICPTNLTIHTIILGIQILCSIAGIIYFTHLFVNTITFFAQITQINPMILSLFLAPIATELPEIFNSIIWVKESKDNIAFANLSGAIVYQASILPAIGLLLTKWTFSIEALINVILVYASVITLYITISKCKKNIPVKIFFFNGFYWLIYIIYVCFDKGIIK